MGSEDPEGEALLFHWRVVSQPSGSLAVLGGGDSPEATLQPDAEGQWVLELVVTAGNRRSHPERARLLVSASTGNRAPVASATSPSEVSVGTEAELDARASFDPDGDRLEFRWQLIGAPAGAAFSALPLTETARVTPLIPGRYEWELSVTDPFGARSFDRVSFAAVPTRDGGGPEGDGGVKDGGVALDAGPDVLLPNEIYLLGTVAEGLCGRDALARLERPDVASVGFICDFVDRPLAIHPQTGRLLQLSAGRTILREYRCDVCRWSRGDEYPHDVLLNDPIVPTPCSVGNFRVSADGAMVYFCDGAWRDASRRDVSPSGNLYALGARGWALTNTVLDNYATGVRLPIVGLQLAPSNFLTTRWREPSSFMVVISVLGEPELWDVSTTDGHATRLGSFSPLPATISTPFGAPVLDPAGRLYQQAHDDAHPFVEVVVRREVGGTSAVVYTEATSPLVRLNASRLLTGP